MKSCIPVLMVEDIERSLRFYNDVLGFETSFTMPDENGVLVHASVRHGDTEVMLGLAREVPAELRPHLGIGASLYFTVEDGIDVDAYCERARAAGGEIVQEPTDQFWGHRDWGIADPDGHRHFISKEVRQVNLAEMTAPELVATD